MLTENDQKTLDRLLGLAETLTPDMEAVFAEIIETLLRAMKNRPDRSVIVLCLNEEAKQCETHCLNIDMASALDLLEQAADIIDQDADMPLLN
jgi:hypothetical protein